MKELKKTILTGWPKQKHHCPSLIQDFWGCRTELSVVNDIIFKGSKLVIQVSICKEMLQKVHEGYLGQEKCKQRACEVMYWPRLNQDISNTTASCEICLTYRSTNKQSCSCLTLYPITYNRRLVLTYLTVELKATL